MKLFVLFFTAVVLFASTTTVIAQAGGAAPSGSTGLCRDGSYTSNDTKKGACSGHKGVKDWFGAAVAQAPVKTGVGSPMPTAPSTNPAPAATKATGTPSVSQAPGGRPGDVWVNTKTKVYHCSGTKYYGKTKKGEFVTEAAAKASGAHADHGKACS